MNAQATKYFPSIKVPKKELEFLSSNPTLTNTDFGLFYIAHREFIDKMIAVWTNSYQNRYDVEDIRQEVLYRLQVNDVLTQYNPKKSKLNVFLTMKIRNYIRHAVRDLAPLFMSDEDEFNEYQHIVFDKGQTSDHIICDKGRTFDHICFQDCLEKLKAKRPEVWNFVCKLQEGMTSTEIAEEEKTSRSSINFKYMRVLKSEFVRRLFQ